LPTLPLRDLEWIVDLFCFTRLSLFLSPRRLLSPPIGLTFFPLPRQPSRSLLSEAVSAFLPLLCFASLSCVLGTPAGSLLAGPFARAVWRTRRARGRQLFSRSRPHSVSPFVPLRRVPPDRPFQPLTTGGIPCCSTPQSPWPAFFVNSSCAGIALL